MSLQPTPIFGYDKGGLNTYKKPFLLDDQKWQRLENFYPFRERERKRQGLLWLGRLQRIFTGYTLGPSQASPWTFNLLTISGFIVAANNANPGQITTAYPHGLSTGDTVTISQVGGATGYNGKLFTITVVDPLNFTVGADATGFGAYTSGGVFFSNRSLSGTEPNAELNPGSVVIVLGAITFIDQGNGLLTSVTPGNSGVINYVTGSVTLTHTAGVGAATTLSLKYFPSLPVMGITQYEQPGINVYTTIWFDTKYAYIWNGMGFQEFIPGTTWAGTNSDFFWTTNYRGTDPSFRLFFATNFVNDAADPMRYTDGATWTTFAPGIAGATPTSADNTFLFQARILIPYFGRLLALNTWEGNSIGSATNIFNRCRFSQIGNPIQQTVVGPPFVGGAWRSDVFGKGGFLDAPTNEMITGATFLNNTLIVFFEKTTWQLRYVGEYGLPFIWERIASDLGSDSTFSSVLFNNNILAIGDKAIITADSNSVDRIDLEIPDQIFKFQDINDGVKRVGGIRDYQKELVFWTYPEVNDSDISADALIFPNRVLVFNYRNQQWSVFRDNITAFGTFQNSSAILWSNLEIFWNDQGVYWDDPDTKENFPSIVSGNQQGFCHYYGYTTPDDPSLSITAISTTGYGTSSQLVTLTIPNHNLENADIIYLYPLVFDSPMPVGNDLNINFINAGVPIPTDLNGRFFSITVVDANNVTISEWSFVNQEYVDDFSFTPNPSTNTYVGGGQAALMPVPALQTKDFNIYQTKGLQTKLSRLDFLMDTVSNAPNGDITGATNANPCVITSVAHGLKSGQKVTINGVQGMTQLNVGMFYTITVLTVDTFSINVDSTNFGTYVALTGKWTLVCAALSVQLFINSSQSISGNILTGNLETRSALQPPFGSPASDYTWQRFYTTCAGQYFNVLLTYDDNIKNVLWTHEQELDIHGMVVWTRPGGTLTS